jgi:ADP-ribose pyrophosphatase
MKQYAFEILDRHIAYAGFFQLLSYRLRHQLYRGGWSRPLNRELFERGHAVAVLPYDPLRDEIILIEQFRIGAIHAENGAWLTEIVAGIIEPDESPETVARREAIEESGCPLLDLEKICEYFVSPGGTSETITLFCGRVDSTDAGGVHGCADEDEDIRVFTCAFSDAMDMIRDGRINSASPIMALQWLALNRDRLRKQWQ